MTKNKLIHQLIKEELRNKRLMYSLEDLGFDCSAFTLDISQTILELMCFNNRPDELYQWYFSLIDMALDEITFWNMDETLKKWSDVLYKELRKKLNEQIVNSLP
jgi:hypothetical protein